MTERARRRKPIRRFVLRHVLPPVALHLYRALGDSWRYVTDDESTLLDLVNGERPIVGAFLHARTFQFLHYFSQVGRGRWILMCSQSRDGNLMSRVEEGLGFRVARGSSGNGGARALVEMIRAQRVVRGLNSCLAVDGSRGPRGIAQLGILTLAQKTGGLVLPIAASTGRCWVYSRSWDRTVIPKPRAEIRIRTAEPFEVPTGIDQAQVESLRMRLERTLLSMHTELDSQTGFTDPQPLRV